MADLLGEREALVAPPVRSASASPMIHRSSASRIEPHRPGPARTGRCGWPTAFGDRTPASDASSSPPGRRAGPRRSAGARPRSRTGPPTAAPGSSSSSAGSAGPRPARGSRRCALRARAARARARRIGGLGGRPRTWHSWRQRQPVRLGLRRRRSPGSRPGAAEDRRAPRARARRGPGSAAATPGGRGRGEEGDRLPVRADPLLDLGGSLVEGRRPVGEPGVRVVRGDLGGDPVERHGICALEALCHAPVEQPAMHGARFRVGDLADLVVGEVVRAVSLLADDLPTDQLVQPRRARPRRRRSPRGRRPGRRPARRLRPSRPAPEPAARGAGGAGR